MRAIPHWEPEDVEPMIDSLRERELTDEADLLAWVWRNWQACGEALNAATAAHIRRDDDGSQGAPS